MNQVTVEIGNRVRAHKWVYGERFDIDGEVVQVFDGYVKIRDDDGNEDYYNTTNDFQNGMEVVALGDWRDDPATPAQIRYLVTLNVDVSRISGELTKGRASEIIDAAKNGELGIVYSWYTDGSN